MVKQRLTMDFLWQFLRKYHIEFGVLDKENGVAYGTYDDALITTGYVKQVWSKAYI